MPHPRISSQPDRLQTGQPRPPQITHEIAISALGSVNGKYDGTNRARVSGPKNARAKCSSTPFRSEKRTPSSTTNPSIC